jgi:hypothetical protein
MLEAMESMESGVENLKWTEKNLDMHYLQSMLLVPAKLVSFRKMMI